MFNSGEPLVLSDDWFQATMRRAQSALQDERVHTLSRQNPLVPSQNTVQATCNIPDPDVTTVQQQAGVADPLEIWKMLPALKDIPESILRQLPRSDIFELNAAIMKENKTAGKIQTNAKLMLNAQNLEKNPVRVEAGLDDRKMLLHNARFTLGGASCSAQQLWLQAREVLGPKGILPLGNYDMDTVGCGGSVSPRGWSAIQDPSSSELKLKLFYLPNVGGSSQPAKRICLEDAEGLINVESLKEISDMDAFRSALNALREAMVCALPWNRSISAICGFLQNTNFCSADLLQNNKRAQILTEFVDHVLTRNALNWENKQPFLSADDLAHTWATWKARRVTSSQKPTEEGGQAKRRHLPKI
jgi:hypothetical protein